MTSSYAYDPDEFENNNPFAEPEDYPQSLPETAPIRDDSRAYPETTPSQDPYQDASQREPTQQETEGEAKAEDGKLVKEELMRLLPERFTNKYKMKLTLKAVEKNKPDNPILRFDASVSGLSKYRKGYYKDIRRTYNEVVKFNKYLSISNLEVFVPVLPLYITSYPTGGEDEIKQLFYVWQEWMDRITQNPILIRDEEFVFFIENEAGYSVINSNRKASVASGLVRRTLKQLAVPYDPYVELAEFRPVVKAAYLLSQRLHKQLEKAQKCDRQLAFLVSELSTKLKGLSHFENVHPGMKNMWEKLANVSQMQSELLLVQLMTDMGSLGDGILALINELYEIKEALTNRHLIMRELNQAQAQTRAKHMAANKVKSRSSLDPIRVDEALSSLEYATRAEENLHQQVKRISGEMMFEKKEASAFLELKFQRMLKLYSLCRVDQSRKLLKSLENIRLDVRIIDSNGGLSRLNRGNLTLMKHKVSQSQEAYGDAWSSRTFRSLDSNEAAEQKTRAVEDIRTQVDAKQAASILGVATF